MRPLAVYRRLLVLVLASLCGASSIEAQEQVVPEYDAKAGFLTTFTNYATWPADAFSSPDSPVVVCVLGGNPFGHVLAETAAATRGGRPVQVRNLQVPSGAGCHVVFIAKSESRREAEWLAAFTDLPVLTVGESGQTVANGGAVEFATRGARITFDVNLPAVKRTGVMLSSDLLAHARKVYR